MYVIKRSPNNPLIAPTAGKSWEARGTFNGCPVIHGKKICLLYRALGAPDALMVPGGLSTIGRAYSADGEHFHDRRQFITPAEEWDRYGCEDPRVTYFEGQFVIFYTALGGVPFGAGNIKVAVALSKDLETVTERHLVTPFNAKAMALFPERIDGKITAVFTIDTDVPPKPARIAIAQCEKLEELWSLDFWEQWHADLDQHIINPLRSDQDHIEVGTPPIKTKDGWLLLYSYFQDYYSGEEHRMVGIEGMLLDLNEPTTIIAKTHGPMLGPEEIYERYGIVPNVVFPSGALVEKNRVDLYYGAADTVCAKASFHLPDMLASMIPARRGALVERAKGNPILQPLAEHSWESRAVFNPGAIEIDDTIHLLYRAMSQDNTSVIGYAASKDGTKISERDAEPAYVPREEFEQKRGGINNNSGCEDPRITRIGNTVYMAYTAYDGTHAPRAALTSISVKDFLAKRWNAWQKPVLITPDDHDDKDTCIFPEKVDGKYLILHRISPQICADLLDSLDFTKNRISRCIELLEPRPGFWDSQKVGIGGVPIKTERGWLLIYHGVSKSSTYRLGAALFDLDNPTMLIARTVDPIFEPREQYERDGQIHNVVFTCGAVARKDTIYIYYGGADTCIGVAKVSLNKLLAMLLPADLK